MCRCIEKDTVVVFGVLHIYGVYFSSECILSLLNMDSMGSSSWDGAVHDTVHIWTVDLNNQWSRSYGAVPNFNRPTIQQSRPLIAEINGPDMHNTMRKAPSTSSKLTQCSLYANAPRENDGQ